ncbi:bile acid:sodium symporter family protein [Corynebacterium mycetoides]|uniref:bile acid:sodium symporter family protein n=1 Tax=Corynebacterium mycetoides TaxID=38302 RepID=UPI001E5BDC90|nr:hypothetical protein [Corynebacterium mycetoides]
MIEIGLPIALFVIMIGIGLSLTSADFAFHARRPRASVVGLIGQLTLPPLMALGIAWAFGLAPLMALGVVLVAAAPGGATSNLATYLARGSVALLIGVILTPVAIGMVLRAKQPQLAEKIERFVGMVGVIVLVLLIAGAPVAGLLNVCLILIGGLVGWLGRLDVKDQLAITFITASATPRSPWCWRLR